jgi:hypothetical protein
MEIFKELKKTLIKEKKLKNKSNTGYCIMLIDCIEKMAKEKNKDPEEFVVSGAKKHIKQLKEAEEKGMDNSSELKYLEEICKFIPTEVTEEETTKIIRDFIIKNKNTNIGQVMKYLRTIENINMKIASKISKDLLK